MKKTAFLFGALLFLAPVQSSWASVPVKRVLVLFAYENNLPAFVLYDAGLRSTLKASREYQVEIYDPVQLQQVVLNLVLNGTEAMRNTPLASRKLLVKTASQDDHGTAMVSVTDSGPGFDERHIGLLFEPFYTTKPEGMGMGLCISQTIVKAHGGALTAANNREGGAVFRLTHPASREDQP